jgi:thioredoxin reductase
MHHDAIIVGGSFAGLSAAMYLARARRSVCVVDAGAPRNRFAQHSHGFFAQDGSAPGAILDTARAQVAAYPTVTFVQGKVASAEAQGTGFGVALEDGRALESERLVLAFGLSDELPEIAGLKERWGRSVLHCPYCHGYEYSGQRLGVLATMPVSVHQAMLIAEWGPTTIFVNDALEPEPEVLAEFDRRGVSVERGAVTALHGEGDSLSAVELAGGRMRDIDALFVGLRSHMNSDIAGQLGCAMDEAPFGQIIRTDGLQMTSVPNVFAAGDIARGAHSIAFASADGVMAGVAAHRSLVF